MSQQPSCPECHEPMQMLETDTQARPDPQDLLDMTYQCTNPECPNMESDLAEDTGPPGGASVGTDAEPAQGDLDRLPPRA